MKWNKNWMKPWLSSRLKKAKPAGLSIQGGRICLIVLFQGNDYEN
jgi:hypothetical protein